MRYALKSRPAHIGETCFRLVTLVVEEQNEVEVVKPVLQDLEVMRLSCALGMLTTVNTKDFEFDLLEPHEFDDDFARFLRQSVFGATSSHDIQVMGVFGKQADVKLHLERLGAWSADMEANLDSRDQGIFAVLMKAEEDGDVERKVTQRVIIFGWLQDCLFAHEHLRGTPTYILRCLTCLSNCITCCLSEADAQSMQSLISTMNTDDVDDWKSYSVAFRVQRQQDEADDVRTTLRRAIPLPSTIVSRGLTLIKGNYPALTCITESPKTKISSKHQELFYSPASFGQWLVSRGDKYVLHFNSSQWREEYKEAVVRCANKWPQEELERLSGEHTRSLECVDDQCRDEVQMRTEDIRQNLLNLLPILFDPKEITGGCDEYKHAIGTILSLIGELRAQGLIAKTEEAFVMLYLPIRLRKLMEKMMTLHEANMGDELDELLEQIPIKSAQEIGVSRKSLLQKARGIAGYFFGKEPTISPKFELRMKEPLGAMKQMWWSAVEQAFELYSRRGWVTLSQEKKQALDAVHSASCNELISKVLASLHGDWSTEARHDLKLTVRVRERCGAIICEYDEEKWKPASDRLQLWKICANTEEDLISMPFAHLGGFNLDSQEHILALFTIQNSSVLVIATSSKETIVRCIKLSPARNWCSSWNDERPTHIRTLHRCTQLVDFSVKDRMLVLVDDADSAVLYRLNEAMTGMEIARRIDVRMRTSLSIPLRSVLLVDGLLSIVDGTGAMQSVNIRNEQTSRKCDIIRSSRNVGWRGVLFPLLNGDALCSFTTIRCDDGGFIGKVDVMAAEDNRRLPSSESADVTFASADGISTQMIGETMFVTDPTNRTTYLIDVSATVRSDSYRIRRTANAGGSNDNSEGEPDEEKLSGHWMWAFYHLFEKFPVRGLLEYDGVGKARSEFGALQLQVLCSLGDPSNEDAADRVVDSVESFVRIIMSRLSKLNKPLLGMNLVENLRVWNMLSKSSGEGALGGMDSFTCQSILQFLQTLVTFVPVQICRTERNALEILVNGQETNGSQRKETSNGLQSADIAHSIRFGLLSPLLRSWQSQCVVITSMGKQSTGKSYFLNHLTGSSFAIAGARCTDGAWMSARVLPNGVLLVVLDFEGLGSFERTEQEDVFLSVLNASVSMLTVFRMEMRFDKEIDELFSKFQKGSQLLKRDSQLFRGTLYMSVKDVNPNDQHGVVHEFEKKFGCLLETNKEQNFLTDMYAGQLEVNCSPPLGTVGYYRSLKQAQAIINDGLCQNPKAGFRTGKEFSDCLRLVLAKISILDWTSLDESAFKFKLTELSSKLPGIARFGAITPDSERMEGPDAPMVPKDELRDALTGGVIDVTFEDVCDEYPELQEKWRSIASTMCRDEFSDGKIDLGAVLTDSESSRLAAISSAILNLFWMYFDVGSGSGRVSADMQREFDVFLSFVIRRRRVRIQNWSRSQFGGRIPEDWKPLEQNVMGPLQNVFVRCLDHCKKCLLGCMKPSAHSIVDGHDHNCGTNHLCHSECEYCRESGGVGKTPACSKPAGHGGRCECSSGDHTCRERCDLQGAVNCGKRCAEMVGHSGEQHRCSVSSHKCGQPCVARNCPGKCMLDMDSPHTAHKCAIDRCLENCVMEGCVRTCSSSDHFHGHIEAKVACSVESVEETGYEGKNTQTFDDGSELPTIHMCASEHSCPGTCEENGVCHVNVFLKQSSKMFAGARGNFQYTFQEMNGARKKCAIKLNPGEKIHAGPHTCKSTDGGGHDDKSDDIQHYCESRCPCCSYVCQREFGHSGTHKTVHGNMRNTIFLSEDHDFDLMDRKYRAGERGTAEMCSLYCSKMGREHVHYMDCEQDGRASCVYTGGLEDMRRHCTRALEPKPDKEKDELLHERFWETLGWEDPCSSLDERKLFALCGFKCDAPDHDGKEKSFCVLPAWHTPETKPVAGFDGFSYVNGHKFECSHVSSGGKMHHVFVLDCSGSMQGWPWKKLMGAFREYVYNRVSEGASLDLVSVVTFDNSASIECEAQNITTMSQAHVRYRGGGTSYSAGLRCANEVLSRVAFGTYKPVLVFFSDGQPHDPVEGEQLGTHIQLSYAKYGLEAFAVGFGTVNLGVLQRVAERLGGSYHHALTGTELKSTFTKISASLGTHTGLALTKPLHEIVCAICQKDLVTEETVTLVPCNHELHRSCHRSLLQSVSEDDDALLCPMCRREVRK